MKKQTKWLCLLAMTVGVVAQDNNILSFEEAKSLADQGDAYGEAIAAFHYSVGWDTNKNLEMAAQYAQSSAEKKNPLGLFRLGSLTIAGEGVEKNEELGLALQDEALMGLNEMEGNPYSITALGVVLFQGKVLDKDLATAAKLYKKAADMGFAPAQYNYAKCAEFGHGIPKNKAVSKMYLQKSAAQGYPLATGAAQATASKSQTTSNTLDYNSTNNILRGTVVEKVFPGPPNFESIEGGDKPMRRLILQLDSTVDVPADNKDDMNEAEEDVQEVQLNFSDKYPEKKGLNGKMVEVTGGIYHSHTGYHCTAVLMDVKNLVEIDGESTESEKPTPSAPPKSSKTSPRVSGKITGFYNNLCESEESGDMSGTELIVFQSATGAYVVYTLAEGEARQPVLLEAVIENNTVKFTADGENYTGTLKADGLELSTRHGAEMLKKGSYFKGN
jgi:TPR repeat protein